MAKLQVPAIDSSTNLSGINADETAAKVASGAQLGRIQRTQGAEGIASAAQIGQIQENLGNWMGAQGNEMLDKSMKAMEDAMYNIVQSSAVKDYNKSSDDALGQIKQEGNTGGGGYNKASKFRNPQALEGALDGIKNQVDAKYSPGIENPELKAKFGQSLNDLNDNRKMSARQYQRSSEQEVAHSALQDALNTDIQTGLKDVPENIGYYAAQGLDRIKSALDTGTISSQQAAAYGENLRKGLYFGSLQVRNQQDPNGIANLLASKTPQELNLNDMEYNTLSKQNKFSLHDAEVLGKLQYKTQQELENSKKSINSALIKSQIKKGEFQSAQLVEAYDKGKIDFKQYTQLANQYIDRQDKVDKTLTTRNKISASIASGEYLSAFSNDQIDDHYNNRLAVASNNGTTKIPIEDKVNLATEYKGPIKSLTKEIEWGINTGEPEKIKDSIYAYNRLIDENPLVLSDMKDSKLTSYISALSNAYKYTDSLDKQNIQKIHDSIYDVDGRTLKKRENEFSTHEDFSDDKIRKTIANMYEGGNPWYRGSDHVDDSIIHMVKPLLRDAYRETGSVDDAIRAVSNKTKFLVGHSDVNNVPKWGLDAGTVMAVPPERVYGDKATASDIRMSINEEVKDMLPKGVSPDQVMVGSDDLTVDRFRNKLNPSYYLYYLDSDNKEVLLPKRWSLDDQSLALIQKQKADAIQVNVDPAHKVTPTMTTRTDVKTNQSASVMEPHKQMLADTLHSDPATKSIFNDKQVEEMAASAYIPEIANKYRGDIQSKPTVRSAIERMVGEDTDSWRVGQSLKLVNSVLTNNSNPRTYLKYGTATDSPMQGDIVVTKNKAGLFQGYSMMNGKSVVRYTSMQNGNLTPSVVPLSEVAGFRSLPTPENFVKQVEPAVPGTKAPGFNIYTGGPSRTWQKGDQLDIYNNKVILNDPNAPKKNTIIDAATGQMVDVNQSMQDRIKQISSSSVAQNSAQQQSSSSSGELNIVANPGIENSKQVEGMSLDSIIQKLSSDQVMNIDVGNGQSVTAGELVSRLGLGKVTNAPTEGGVVIANGLVGTYAGLDPEDSNKVKVKVGKKTISMLKTDIQEYREMPKGKDAKRFLMKIRALLDGKANLKDLEEK